MITLVQLDDADFDWMSGTSIPRIPGWKLPPGGRPPAPAFRRPIFCVTER